MRPERKLADLEWQRNKKENRQNNVALFEGVRKGVFYRQLVTARILFRGVIHGEPRDKSLQPD